MLHCLRLDMSFHKAHAPGELIERLDGDVTALGNFFSQMVIRLFGNALLAMGVLTFCLERTHGWASLEWRTCCSPLPSWAMSRNWLWRRGVNPDRQTRSFWAFSESDWKGPRTFVPMEQLPTSWHSYAG